MNDRHVDIDSLIGQWRTSFEAARSALHAGSRDLPLSEVKLRSTRLADERAATAQVLESLARDRHAKPQLVRVVVSPWEAKRLIGLPDDADACVFSLEGVLIGSAAIHAAAWKETLDEFISGLLKPKYPIALFDEHRDYPQYIHGRPRLEGVREFLASRGLSLPEGAPTDRPGVPTVHGLANRKKRALLRRVRERGVTAFEGARLYLQLAHDAGVHNAIVTASANTETMLARAALTDLIDDRVDGNTIVAHHLRPEPAADTLVTACRHLGVPPAHAVAFETTPAGIAAARAGGFELVVGVGRGDAAGALLAQGADRVVTDLGEILERNLAA